MKEGGQERRLLKEVAESTHRVPNNAKLIIYIYNSANYRATSLHCIRI